MGHIRRLHGRPENLRATLKGIKNIYRRKVPQLDGAAEPVDLFLLLTQIEDDLELDSILVDNNEKLKIIERIYGLRTLFQNLTIPFFLDSYRIRKTIKKYNLSIQGYWLIYETDALIQEFDSFIFFLKKWHRDRTNMYYVCQYCGRDLKRSVIHIFNRRIYNKSVHLRCKFRNLIGRN